MAWPPISWLVPPGAADGALPTLEGQVPTLEAPGAAWPPLEWGVAPPVSELPPSAAAFPPEAPPVEPIVEEPVDVTAPPTLPQATDADRGRATPPQVQRDPAIGYPPPEWGYTPPAAPTTEPLAPIAVEEQATFLEAQGPEYIATQRARLEDERAQQTAERLLEETERNRRAAVENKQTYDRARERATVEHDEIRAEAKKLGAQQIDPDRWWASRSTGQEVAAYLSAAIAGYLNPTGKNSALENIMAAIDRDIQVQQANLANARGALEMRAGLVGDLFARTGDEYRAAETARLAAMEGIDARLAAEAQKYEPGSTSALRIAETRQGLAAEAAQAEAARDQAIFDRQIKVGEFELKERHQAEQERSNRAREGIDRGRLNIERQKVANEARASGGLIPFDASGMSVAEWEKKAAEAQARGEPPPPMQRWTTGDKKIDQEMTGKYAAYRKLDVLYGKLEDHIRQSPSTTMDIVNRTRWRADHKKRTEQLQGQIDVAFAVANGMGAIAGADVKIAQSVVGGELGSGGESVDIVRAARDDAHDSVQAEFEGHGFTGRIPRAPTLTGSKQDDDARARADAEEERLRREKYGKGSRSDQQIQRDADEYTRRAEEQGQIQQRGTATAPSLTTATPPGAAAPPGLPPVTPGVQPPLLPPPEPVDYSRYIHQPGGGRGRR